MELRNQGVIVTGASRGLGEALSAELAARGAKVAMVAREREALAAAVSRVRARGGVAHALPFDVGDKEQTHRIAATAAELVGDVSVLVHNASTLGPVPLRPLLDTACEELEAVLQVNLVGPFRLTKAVAGGMLLRGRGLVVSISSDAAVEAYPTWGAYSVSKAAQDHLSRVLAAECAPVTFVSVDPGEMDTRMHADAVPDADRASLGKPEDVAKRLAALIASEHARSGARVVLSSWRPS